MAPDSTPGNHTGRELPNPRDEFTAMSSRRRTSTKLSLLVLLLPVLGLGSACATPAPHAYAAPSTSAAITSNDWQRLQQQLIAREYKVRPSESGLQATNRVHNLRSYFAAEGIRVVDRTAEDSPVLLGIRWTGWGRGESLPVGAGALHDSGNRVEISRAHAVEWFINSPSGVEHGIDVAKRPAGDVELRFQFDVTYAKASLDGQRIRFTTPTLRVIDYQHLVVTDATGRTLPARFELPNPARFAILVDDRDAVYPIQVDPLLTSPPSHDRRIQSNQAGADFGWTVSNAGDVNADGFADIIVGAPNYDPGLIEEGAAWVFLGSSAGVFATAPGGAFAEYRGLQTGGDFGNAVAGVGDVNGDGFDDVAVGGVSLSYGQDDEGAVSIFLGGAVGVDGTPLSAFTTVESNVVGATLGWSVAGAGDVDADGYADIIAGAPGHGGGSTNGGAIYLIHGNDVAPLTVSPAITSHLADAFLGKSVAGLGDVNGDAIDDVAAGAHGYSDPLANEGAVFVFHGSKTGIVATTTATADTEIQGNVADVHFGFSVNKAGDVNGDGYADLIAGAPFWGIPGIRWGQAFVFHGGPAGVSASDAASADSVLTENEVDSQMGMAVAGIGDVDGNGYADVAVGAPNETKAWVYGGGPSGVAESPLLETTDGLGVSNFGRSVSGADLNGDGRNDLVVGANDASYGQTGEGVVEVFHGGTLSIEDFDGSLSSPQLDGFVSGEITGHDFGASVSASGDVNADGFDDLVVSSAGTFGPGKEVYVFHGSATGVDATTASSADQTLVSPDAASDNGFGFAARIVGDLNGDGYDDVAVAQSVPNRVYLYYGSVTGISATPDSELTGSVDGLVWYLDGAGDVNGDGFADLLVGDPFYEGATGSDRGAAFVLHGGPLGIPSQALDAADGQVNGFLDSGVIGLRVGGIGDVNGDGYADVAVGSAIYQAVFESAGLVAVFHGGPLGIGTRAPSLADALITGDSDFDGVGEGIAGADINGDGYSDLIISKLGSFLVYHGSATGIFGTGPSDANREILTSTTARVGSAGDIDGDGYADLVVGAPFADLQGNDSGGAYVFRGSAAGLTAIDLTGAAAELSGDNTQTSTDFGDSVSAGDLNGDGVPDLVVGASNQGADVGAAFIFLGGRILGRPIHLEQLPYAGSDDRLGQGGGSGEDGFRVRMRGHHPDGRGLVKLQIQYCPPGIAFFQLGCFERTQADWTDTGATSGVDLTESVFASANQTYRWRARILRAPRAAALSFITEPPNPSHGPWYRPFTQTREGDVRTVPEASTVLSILFGAALIALAKRRYR